MKSKIPIWHTAYSVEEGLKKHLFAAINVDGDQVIQLGELETMIIK